MTDEIIQCPCSNCRERARTAGGTHRWLRPGDARPAGWVFTGCVSTWPDTGKVRAELWERSE